MTSSFLEVQPLSYCVFAAYSSPLQSIPDQMNAARNIAEHFSELAKEIEVFPQKVATAIRVQAQSTSVLGRIWYTIKWFALLPPSHANKLNAYML